MSTLIIKTIKCSKVIPLMVKMKKKF